MKFHVQPLFDHHQPSRDHRAVPRGGAAGVFAPHDSQHNRVSEEWKFALYAHPSSWNVGITDDGKVALMIDQGRPTEQTLTLSWDHVAELGKRLVDLAASGPSIRGTSN